MIDKESYLLGKFDAIMDAINFLSNDRNNLFENDIKKYNFRELDWAINRLNIMNKYMLRFQDYLNITESPMRFNLNNIDIKKWNDLYSQRDVSKYKHIDNITINNIELKILIMNIDINNELVFVDGSKIVFIYNYISKENNKIEERLLWQNPEYKGYAYNIYIEYILKKYKNIITDKATSQFEERFLYKIFTYCIQNKILVNIILNDVKIIDTIDDDSKLDLLWQDWFTDKVKGRDITFQIIQEKI